MGLAIRYRGVLDRDCLPGMAAEVGAIAQQCGWAFSVFEEGQLLEVDTRLLAREERQAAQGTLETESLSGLLIRPHVGFDAGCETLSLLFDPQGKLCEAPSGAAQKPSPEGWLRWQADLRRIDAHVGFIELLKFLRRNYFARLEVVDEGNYWDTGEGAARGALREKIQFLLGKLEPALSVEKTPFANVTPLLRELGDAIEDTVREIWKHD